MRELVGFACDQCKRKNYTTTKNKKTTTDKLAFKKFCSFCRTHTQHREVKI
ncbi:MAG TPA: 50S ribosomal protein L33 [Candidatus Binatia bacterium]|nr:50S ribosomal protein L33 [Candidatus Binatia bacterium]